ncbi:hypothetical protein C1I89_10345 [Achromobacter pulmonis]|uniref:Uncharacterized protein n=1 Tax=Achromobacter pulmonis TaxID=1389932 RepID=A0A2N8KM91_9BURK|nr:hypothetical protein [Achromobacter pulmonis]PND34570.1 hypothetical protein C1I89_10345 [Achromobacter pulmonis]
MTINNHTPPLLTDEEILALEIEAGGTFAQGPVPFARAVESALLSKLRAEDAQASDERAAFEAYVQKRFGGLAEPWDANAARYPYGPDQARWEAWRAALAWYAEQVAGCRKIGADGDAARQALDKDGGRRARAALASAPVAGEAKNYPGDNVAERLDKMADDQPPGSQVQSDLYAAATIWRKHIAHRAAPQASEADGLIDALGQCRDAFPIPDKVGSKLDLLWQEAMSDPTAVPEYVKLCAALSAQPGAQKGKSDE